MIHFQLTIIHLFATISTVIPVFNLLPFKIKSGLKTGMFITFFTVLHFSITILHVGDYINIFIIPIFILIVSYCSKKYALPNFIMSIISYLITIVSNSIIISLCLKTNINIITSNIFGQILFLLLYNFFIVLFTFILGKLIRKNLILFDNFRYVCNTKLKKVIIILPITLSLIFYSILIMIEKSNNYPIEITLSITIKFSVIFGLILILYTSIFFVIYNKIKKYEKKVSNLAECIDQLKDLDDEDIKNIENIIKLEEDDLTKIITNDIIDIVKKSK